MGTILAWTGLFLFLVLPKYVFGTPVEFVGAVVMGIGIAIMWLKR